MRKVKFIKMVGSGNYFVVVSPLVRLPVSQLKKIAQEICNRKFGVGADGLLILEKSKVADVRMRIFNPDGSEAEMCGNGTRCTALWLKSKIPVCPAGRQNPKSKILKIETKAGIIEAKVSGDNVNPARNTKSLREKSKISNGVKIRLTDPQDIKSDISIKVNNRPLRVHFINTGVPHTVIFVEGLDEIDVFNIGRRIRNHKKFKPVGTNVDFVEVLNNHSIKIRTYERGVEDETLACGTGAVASALMANGRGHLANGKKINIHTRSGEILKVYFQKIKNKFTDLWLEGKARIVYKGEYNV